MTARKPPMGDRQGTQPPRGVAETVWLFGLHAVRDALHEPAREKLRLVLTKNAADKLADAIAAGGLEPEIVDPRKFDVPIDENSVHQGAALEARPLDWGRWPMLRSGARARRWSCCWTA
jgi:23S rRNA (guanosine2251-2'-O)-methyltransferase